MKAILMAFLLLGCLAGQAQAAEEKPDYRGTLGRIDEMLKQAASDYRAGSVDAAKTTVQNSYFQLFEGLEGPIRINISAKRGYQLESEFAAIRKLMVDGASPDEVERRISAHIAALEAIMPVLEKGAVLVAQKSEEGNGASPEADLPDLPKKVEPYWEEAVATIHDTLIAAADALDKGDAAQAKALITKAQFDGYKNSELTIAIRRYVSQQQDGVFEAEFRRIQTLVSDGRPASLIRGSARVLTEELTARLPGLPLVGAAAEAAKEAPAPSADWKVVAERVNTAIAKASALIGDGKSTAAIDLLQSTYFDVFEASGMEARIGVRDDSLKTVLEAHFSKLMSLAGNASASAAFTTEAGAMAADLARAVTLLGGGDDNDPLSLFGYALLIILREGFEAMIIVTAIIAYLVKTGHGDQQRIIGHSVLVALLASVATAVLLKLAFREAAASQEVLEGATMLVAAAVLFSVSYWLVSKAEAQKWSDYIKDKVAGSLSSGSVRALWFTSFLAVYREGAETVLFYQALTTTASTSGLLAIAGGFALGCLGLAVIYWGMRAGALRLPIRPFFQATSALLYLMAFVFAGKGVMELVEGKIFTPTLIPWAPEFPALGLYPYWQSLAPQAVLVIAALVSLAVIVRQRGTEAVNGRQN
ncbi:FTR1 family iron permease [Telmatospirillum siberiense]|uniref:Iron permease n=1 Tax=Telmatospirillum siberiense TaxID=382514 RepID=A0A2N3PM17_9PROT|nr:FTR1 family protein [Telmatospirillum siberiense]PKU21441.1 iron permease [Telmatospirillum siberiense]